MLLTRVRLYSLGIALFLSWLLAACEAQSGLRTTQATRVPSGTVGELLKGKDGQLLEPDLLISATPSEDETNYPKASAALWAEGFLWTANESGLLTRWDVKTQDYTQFRLPDEEVIRALISDGQAIYAGTEGGQIWRLAANGQQTQIVDAESGWISAMALDRHHNLWYADANYLDPVNMYYHVGKGLVSLALDSDHLQTGDEQEKVYSADDERGANDHPLREVTALVFDRQGSTLWIGTRLAGLFSYDVQQDTWQRLDTLNSHLNDNTILDLAQTSDGSLWLATDSGVSTYRKGAWENHHLAQDAEARGAMSLAVGEDGVWVTGKSYVAHTVSGETWQVYHFKDNPLLLGRSRFVVLDDENQPWLIGRRGKIHFDGQTWIAFDADVRRFATFMPFEMPTDLAPPPLDFPPPTRDYAAWLKTWPRPEADNGRCIHFVQAHQFDAIQAQRQVNRMKRLGMRWTLVHYADHEQLVRTAPIFQEAGMTVVWRPFIRPYQTYPGWAEDVRFLRSRGLAPYIQLYNEPSLNHEWGDTQRIDQQEYLQHLLPAARQVYDAGGYVGLQFVDPEWLRASLRMMKSQGMDDVFDRLFFIPHLYGLNHPPGYEEDINSVLGFREFARIFEEEIGFAPVMIAGEGGWRPGEAQDNRFPAISEELHRDYHLAVFDWFRTGRLSNGETLPDYFLAFCPWLISDPTDPAAWFDSESGDRRPTIKSVEEIPPFERKFSWDR